MKRYSTNKDLNKLANEAVREGWTIEQTSGNHLRWTPPGGGKPIFTALTPSCNHAVKNVRSNMRQVMKQKAMAGL